MSIATARKRADRLFVEFGGALPVDVSELAQWRGLALETATDWPERLCACYFPAERKITVNGSHVPTRRRFSIAHELGHFLLGHEQIDIEHGIESIFGDEDESYNVAGELEREANAFAASLLMPKQWIRQEQRGRTIQELVSRIADPTGCWVSPPAAWYRLMELRLVRF